MLVSNMPNNIIDLIARCYRTEYVHLLSITAVVHFIADMDHILENFKMLIML